jgi:hypothetical protein
MADIPVPAMDSGDDRAVEAVLTVGQRCDNTIKIVFKHRHGSRGHGSRSHDQGVRVLEI